MKQCLLSQVASCCLLAALGSAPASAVPEGAASAIAAPVTRGLEVNADSGVAAGSQLRLTLEGSYNTAGESTMGTKVGFTF